MKKRRPIRRSRPRKQIPNFAMRPMVNFFDWLKTQIPNEVPAIPREVYEKNPFFRMIERKSTW